MAYAEVGRREDKNREENSCHFVFPGPAQAGSGVEWWSGVEGEGDGLDWMLNSINKYSFKLSSFRTQEV